MSSCQSLIHKMESLKQNTVCQRVFAIRSLGQARYLSAVKNSSAVIGNSSSGIIEAPAFDVPTVNIGSRQKGRLAAGSVVHVGVSEKEIVAGISKVLSRKDHDFGEKANNPYG